MKVIGISDFKELVNERLSTPKSFVGKTLLLWNARFTPTDIAYQVVEECCINHNRNEPNDQVWVNYSDLNFDTSNITDVKVCCDIKDMYGFKSHGIFFNNGAFFPNSESAKWLNFVNTHKNSRGILSQDWPLIACVQAQYFTENQFADTCDICILQPAFNEWKQYMVPRYGENLVNQLLAYIKKEGLLCDSYPWEIIMQNLNLYMENHDCDNLSQIPEDSLNVINTMGFPVKDFLDFIHSSKVNVGLS